MVRIKVLVFVLFAYNVFATPIQSTDVDKLKNRLEKVCDDALASIENLNLDNVDKRRAIVSHSSEFAHKVQEAVHKIFKMFVRVDERDSHRILPQLALQLNDVVHEVQEVLITKPMVLRSTLKNNVLKVSARVTKLLEVLQHFTEHKDQGKLKHDVKDIIDKLISAIHQLHVRSDTQYQSHMVNANTHQNFGNEIEDTLNKITTYDDHTSEMLSKAARDFIHTLNHIIYYFQSEVFHFEGTDRKDFDDIVRTVDEVCFKLSTVLNKNDYKDINRKIDDLKTQLSLSIHGVDLQIQRLTKIGESVTGDRAVITDNYIRNIVADTLHGKQCVLWKLQDILHKN